MVIAVFPLQRDCVRLWPLRTRRSTTARALFLSLGYGLPRARWLLLSFLVSFFPARVFLLHSTPRCTIPYSALTSCVCGYLGPCRCVSEPLGSSASPSPGLFYTLAIAFTASTSADVAFVIPSHPCPLPNSTGRSGCGITVQRPKPVCPLYFSILSHPLSFRNFPRSRTCRQRNSIDTHGSTVLPTLYTKS